MTEIYPRLSPTEVCWDDVAPGDHSVQIYVDSQSFLDALEGFASGGLRRGENVVVVATERHRLALERKLARRGYDLDKARLEDRYIGLDAAASLGQIVDNGRLDRAKFDAWTAALMHRAGRNGRRVRAFGEMVALLWEQGHHATTIELEAAWNELCERENFCVFCAYPRSGFTDAHVDSLHTICAHHARVIPD